MEQAIITQHMNEDDILHVAEAEEKEKEAMYKSSLPNALCPRKKYGHCYNLQYLQSVYTIAEAQTLRYAKYAYIGSNHICNGEVSEQRDGRLRWVWQCENGTECAAKGCSFADDGA